MKSRKDMNIFINKSQWSHFDENQMSDYVEEVFRYYRKMGFPYFKVDKNKELSKLVNYSGNVLQEGVVKQTMHGLSLAWSYFPHSWSVRCNNKMTVLEAFLDDDTFKRVIKKRIQMGDNISDNGIRKMLKMFSGVQSVSNFRPTAASALYEHFLPQGGKILDMSSGFGGRLLGAIRANARVGNLSYDGYEPCSDTYHGLINMKNELAGDLPVEIHNMGSEYIKGESLYDFAFTSPPYFNTEVYSDEPTQSCNKFTTQECWLEGFLVVTFSNVFNSLKRKKYMAINIANVPSYPNLEQDTLNAAKRVGFAHTDTFKLALSNSTLRKGKSAYKYEPIFIFQKPI